MTEKENKESLWETIYAKVVRVVTKPFDLKTYKTDASKKKLSKEERKKIIDDNVIGEFYD